MDYVSKIENQRKADLIDLAVDRYTISLPVIAKCLANSGVYEVTKLSPELLRNELARFAFYFKKESRTDRLQYSADEHDLSTEFGESEQYRGFVFTESALDSKTEDCMEMPSRLFGGCCFRFRNYSGGHKWILDWIWLHPFFRNRGNLTKHWDFFEDEFGKGFLVEPPFSPAMESFLKKKKYPLLANKRRYSDTQGQTTIKIAYSTTESESKTVVCP